MKPHKENAFYKIMTKIKTRTYRQWDGLFWINKFFYFVEYPFHLLV